MSPAWGQQALSGKEAPQKPTLSLSRPWVTADPHRARPPVPETPHPDAGHLPFTVCCPSLPAPFTLPSCTLLQIYQNPARVAPQPPSWPMDGCFLGCFISTSVSPRFAVIVEVNLGSSCSLHALRVHHHSLSGSDSCPLNSLEGR